MSELEAVMLAEVEGLLARWRVEYAGRPTGRGRAPLAAGARARADRGGRVPGGVGRRAHRRAGDQRRTAAPSSARPWCGSGRTRSSTPSTCAASCCGGAGWASSVVVYGRQLQGALSGWVTATEHHRDPHTAPLRTGAASALVAIAGLTGRIPKAMQRELHFQTFRRYCDLNVVLEMTAELAYRRLVELAATDDERVIFTRIRDDEQRHTDAFRVLAAALTDTDELADGSDRCRRDREAGGDQRVVPARLDTSGDGHRRRRAAPARSAPARPSSCAAGKPTPTSSRCSTTASTAPGLAERSRGRAHRGHPGVVHARLRPRRPLERQRSRAGGRRGARTCTATASTTSPCSRRPPSTATSSRTVRSPRWRAYFGFESPEYRIVDIGSDLRAVPLRTWARAGGHQRDMGRRRRADRDAEAAHRPHRVRAPLASRRWKAPRARSTRPSTPAAGSTSAPRR